jgi:hypothetical protein
MYTVEIAVILQARDGTMGLSRSLNLSFPPAEGLGLHGITTEPHRAEVIAFVSWDILRKCFYVELLDCHSQEESLSELIDYYGPEWELHEPGFEPVEDT